MFEFLSTSYGMISMIIVCITALSIIFIFTHRYSGVEVGDGKIKFDGTKEADKTAQPKIIRFDDWRHFSIELHKRNAGIRRRKISRQKNKKY